MMCQCGAQAGYPHAPDCPHPYFGEDPERVRLWETARAARADAAREYRGVAALPQDPPIHSWVTPEGTRWGNEVIGWFGSFLDAVAAREARSVGAMTDRAARAEE